MDLPFVRASADGDFRSVSVGGKSRDDPTKAPDSIGAKLQFRADALFAKILDSGPGSTDGDSYALLARHAATELSRAQGNCPEGATIAGVLGEALLGRCAKSATFRCERDHIFSAYPSQICPLRGGSLDAIPRTTLGSPGRADDLVDICGSPLPADLAVVLAPADLRADFLSILEPDGTLRGDAEWSACVDVAVRAVDEDPSYYSACWVLAFALSQRPGDVLLRSVLVRCLIQWAEMLWVQSQSNSVQKTDALYSYALMLLSRDYRSRPNDWRVLHTCTASFLSYSQFLFFSDLEHVQRESNALLAQRLDDDDAAPPPTDGAEEPALDGARTIATVPSEEQEIRLWRLIFSHLKQVARESFFVLVVNPPRSVRLDTMRMWIYAICRLAAVATAFTHLPDRRSTDYHSSLEHSMELLVVYVCAPDVEVLAESYAAPLAVLCTHRMYPGLSRVAMRALKHLARKCPQACVEVDYLRQRSVSRREMVRDFLFRELDSLPKSAIKTVEESQIDVDEDAVRHYEAFLGSLFFQTGVKIRQLPRNEVDPLLCVVREVVRVRETLRQRIRFDQIRTRLETDRQSIAEFLQNSDPLLKYPTLEPIGKGGYGDVFLARNGRQRFALKRIPVQKNSDMKHIYREILTMRGCRHPNIVQFVECFDWNGCMNVIMEYCDGGTLSQFRQLHALDEPIIAYLCRELLQALVYLHASNHVHRDLKCANILLNVSGSVKLADLGLVDEIDRGNRHVAMAGSRNFMAPEMIKREGYDTKVDIWGLGCVIHEMIEHPPYYGEPPLRILFLMATRGAPPLPPPPSGRWSVEFENFVSLCLATDPYERPTAVELLDHVFLQCASRSEEIHRLFEHAFLRDALLLGGLW
jgi:hypothetical protein